MRTRGDVRPAPGIRSAQSANDARPAPGLNRPMARAKRRRIRIGIDTGGTFTDVVAVDEDSGELATTKAPSTPGNPADGFIAGLEKILSVLGADGQDITAVSHGTTVATNTLLEGKVERLGFVTTEGYGFVLEIARQAVPDGYGNSYFWVKPPRIVAADHVRTVGGRMDFEGNEIRPFDEDSAVAAAAWFRKRGVMTIGVCLLHSYANDAHELAAREVLSREHPEAVVSISSEVLREYREYERSMTTLVDAAVKPAVSRYVSNIHVRLDGFTGGRTIPFSVMKSNGGVLSADEVVHQPITTVLSGPAAGALGAALIAKVAGFPRILTCDGGGTSTDVSVVLDGEPTLTTEGTVGAYPSKIPMIDVVTVRAGGAELADRLGLDFERCATGILEISAWNQANALRQVSVKRGLDVRDFMLTTFGGSGSLLACRLVDILDLAGVVVPQNPGNVSAFGLLTVDVKNDYVQTHVAKESALDHAAVQSILDDLTDRARSALAKEGFAREEHRFQRTIDVRYVGQAFEVRVPAPDASDGQSVDASYVERVADAFHAGHRQLYGYDFRGDPGQQVEWVNLRVTGIGPITRPEIPTLDKIGGDLRERAVRTQREVCFDADQGYVTTDVIDRSRLGAGDTFSGPAIVEEFGSTIPVHPGFVVQVDD